MSSQFGKKKLVVFTDCVDVAYSEIYQTICNHLATLPGGDDIHIDPMVSISKFSTINAAFSIRLLSELYPSGTVFLVVVSGVSGSPERVFGEFGNGIWFIGNNSGYFDWTARDLGLKSLFSNHASKQIDSRSFGGKFVQAPTAAMLARKAPPEEIGMKIPHDRLNPLPIQDGTVVHCDNFGLMKIKAKCPQAEAGQQFKVFVNGEFRIKATWSTTMKNCADGSWVIYKGSSLGGLPELGRVRSRNSAGDMGIEVGDLVTWEALS